MRAKTICKLPILTLFLFVTLAAPMLQGQAGPPFQTDDPVPVDYGHYEFYVFGTAGGTPAEIDSLGPAFEFNWGALPRLQLHVIVPWGSISPANNPIYAPGGTGPSAFGFTDMELGAKVAWFKETKHRPQIGSFTMFEIPTGSYSNGLGVGHVWYKLPLWAYKKIGSWGPGVSMVVSAMPSFRRRRTETILTAGCSSSATSANASAVQPRGLFPRPTRLRCRSNASLHPDRRRRLLPLQRPRPSAALRIWAFRRRSDGELCVSRALQDMG
ncbi:MAG: transporter [Acidobacteriota bacterium]|nr:transporter [Acidobacteriota bacterium]